MTRHRMAGGVERGHSLGLETSTALGPKIKKNQPQRVRAEHNRERERGRTLEGERERERERERESESAHSVATKKKKDSNNNNGKDDERSDRNKYAVHSQRGLKWEASERRKRHNKWCIYIIYGLWALYERGGASPEPAKVVNRRQNKECSGNANHRQSIGRAQGLGFRLKTTSKR